MVGRVSKILGGLAASLAVVAAGAGGITWFTAQKPSVDAGRVVQQAPSVPPSTAAASTPPTQLAVDTSTSADVLSVEVNPRAKVTMMSETWIVRSGQKLRNSHWRQLPYRP